jgi:nucleoside-diphosphate-sugar epimerase
MITMKLLITGGSGFIGMHLVDSFIFRGLDFINIDKQKPQKDDQVKKWIECNILEFEKLDEIIKNYQPTHVIHLAANTSVDGATLLDYKDNIEGTKNLIEILKKTTSVKRIIITSSQHVRKPGSGVSNDDEDYVPHGIYGKSKMLTEIITKQANLSCDWIIIRPTTIWGPYHQHLPNGLWKIIKKGFYIHPYNDKVIRSYGYVKNIVWQIEMLLFSSTDLVLKRVYYVGDRNIKQIDWINAFSLALTKKKVRFVPIYCIKLLGLLGDILSLTGIKFPMTSERFFNLTTSNPVPIEPIFTIFGDPPYSLAEGVTETINWMNQQNIYKK